jgi:para-nitrobenzyl esterase
MRLSLSLSCAALLGLLAAACGSPEPASTSSGGSGGGGGAGAAGGSGGAGGGGGEAAPLLVDTGKGPVEGTLLGTTRTFLGIPYAAPPTGDLRWKSPAPHAAWKDKLQATAFGHSCSQMGALSSKFDTNSGEDCLTVNVWTPEKPAASSLPVLVWIHGGGFTIGSGGENAYNGQVLSETTGMVVVTLNYRLGPLGFLAHSDLKTEDAAHPSTGAYGLEDQRAALEWVKANIAAFGGDPGVVTLFGESAGGISTCMQMVSPRSKGLFQRAIIESGPCDTATAEPAAMAQGDLFAKALGCEGMPDVPGCMRSKPIEAVMEALPSSTDFFFSDSANWFPIVDGWNLPDTPGKLLAAGSFEKVPTIVGSNADEGTLFLFLAGDKATIPDDAAFEALAEQIVPGHGAEVVAAYPSAMYGSSKKAATVAVGDAAFICPTRRTARAFAKAGVPTYLYHFTYPPEGALLGNLGAFHSSEVKYVFGNPGQLLPQALTDEELPLSAAIMGYWSRHAAKGDPNGEAALAWPKYDAAKDENIVLDLKISTQAGLKNDLCDFWDGVMIAPL